MVRKNPTPPNEASGIPRDREHSPDERDRDIGTREGKFDGAIPDDETVEPNPPHTTTGKVTAPKFGSAGSGGAELEPGPKRP